MPKAEFEFKAVLAKRFGFVVAIAMAAAGGVSSTSAPGQAPPSARVLPPAPANRELGFVVDHFWLTHEGNDDDCPDGYAAMLRESFIAGMEPGERERLLRPGNENAFRAAYRSFIVRPDGTDICTHMELFDHPAQKTVKGKVAAGFDLDGDASGKGAASGCAHDNFIGRGGESGVDNQHWRAIGCLSKFRPINGTPPSSYRHFGMSLANGENAQAMVLRGIDSWQRDDHVELVWGNTPDRAAVDSAGKFLHGSSYVMSNTPGAPQGKPNVLQGRIVDGTIELHAPELHLRQVYYLGRGQYGEDVTGTRGQWQFHSVRLRLDLQPDGSLKGMLGGYQPVDNAVMVNRLGGAGAALTADWDCPAIHAAVVQMADGDRDPKTGRCTSISTTLEVSAVPAFVVLPGREAAVAGRRR